MKKTNNFLILFFCILLCGCINSSKKSSNNSESDFIYNTNDYDVNDFSIIDSVIYYTPIELEPTILNDTLNLNKLTVSRFNLLNYMEYKEPYRMFYPFVNSTNKDIQFIIAQDENGYDIPLKISFKNGQYFLFGKDYKLLTSRLEESGDLDNFDADSFYNPNFRNSISFIINTDQKKYLIFAFSDSMWWVHHLFDISDSDNIKYYILYSIYTLEEGYSIDNKGQLQFKQKYFYLWNSEDTSQDKYRLIDIP